MKQSETVYASTIAVLSEAGVQFEDGMNVSDVLTKELRSQVCEMVTAAIESGDCDFSESAHAKYPTTDDKRGYVRGLLSNWYRKDERFNGGVKYQPKNPGSRIGSQDEEVKNLRLLIKSGSLTDDQASKAQAYIDDKIAQIKAERNKTEIDMSAIPSDLLEQLGLND